MRAQNTLLKMIGQAGRGANSGLRVSFNDAQAGLAQVAAVTRVKERPGFQIAADLKRLSGRIISQDV
jgi:hypothetical protein